MKTKGCYLIILFSSQFLIFFLSNCNLCQMEHLINPVDLPHMSIWWRAHRKCLGTGGKNLEGDWANYLSVTFNWINHIWAGYQIFSLSNDATLATSPSMISCYVCFDCLFVHFATKFLLMPFQSILKKQKYVFHWQKLSVPFFTALMAFLWKCHPVEMKLPRLQHEQILFVKRKLTGYEILEFFKLTKNALYCSLVRWMRGNFRVEIWVFHLLCTVRMSGHSDCMHPQQA